MVDDSIMPYLNNKEVLIISPENWDHIPVSKHHYARVLAANNNKVYFLNPPSKENKITRDETYPGVLVIDYRTIPGLNRLPSLLRNTLNRYLIRRIKKLCQSTFDVVWSFDPFRFQDLSLFGPAYKIYHAVDVHIAPLEHELAKSSNMILAVSQKILDRFDDFPVLKRKINHGLSDHFLNIVPAPVHGGDKPIRVGYVGNLDNWCIDVPTLLTIVRQAAQVEFNFIGPHHNGSPLAAELKKLTNCKLHGKVNSEKLPAMFSEYDLFLMCYRGDERDVNSNHHKILEYLATGKPVVINYTDEYKHHRDIVEMAIDNSELPGLFTKVINNRNVYSTRELETKRRQFAFANAYQQHVSNIGDMIHESISNG
jgi:glycosyltransferase involved in cell wall biosynthesis